jgi:hypothetical protein
MEGDRLFRERPRRFFEHLLGMGNGHTADVARIKDCIASSPPSYGADGFRPRRPQGRGSPHPSHLSPPQDHEKLTKPKSASDSLDV